MDEIPAISGVQKIIPLGSGKKKKHKQKYRLVKVTSHNGLSDSI